MDTSAKTPPLRRRAQREDRRARDLRRHGRWMLIGAIVCLAFVGAALLGSGGTLYPFPHIAFMAAAALLFGGHLFSVWRASRLDARFQLRVAALIAKRQYELEQAEANRGDLPEPPSLPDDDDDDLADLDQVWRDPVSPTARSVRPELVQPTRWHPSVLEDETHQDMATPARSAR